MNKIDKNPMLMMCTYLRYGEIHTHTHTQQKRINEIQCLLVNENVHRENKELEIYVSSQFCGGGELQL